MIGEEAAAKENLDRTNDFTKQYAVCCKEVGQELGLPVVDLWSSMQEEEVSWRKGILLLKFRCSSA